MVCVDVAVAEVHIAALSLLKYCCSTANPQSHFLERSGLAVFPAVAWRWTSILDTCAHHEISTVILWKKSKLVPSTMTPSQLPNCFCANQPSKGRERTEGIGNVFSLLMKHGILSGIYWQRQLLLQYNWLAVFMWMPRRKLCCQKKNIILQHFERVQILFVFCFFVFVFFAVLGRLPIYIAEAVTTAVWEHWVHFG